MASLLGLMSYLPAVFFLALGVWRLRCSCLSCTRSPSSFIARAWHPTSDQGALKHAELYFLLLSLPLSMGYELAMATNADPLVKGSTPTFRMATFLHLSFLLLIALFVSVSIFSASRTTESKSPSPPHTIPFLLATLAFALQWKILNFDALITPGLESECIALLAHVAGITSLLCGLLALQPHLFLADMCLAMAILLQGFWRLQTGLSLHVDGFVPRGCHRLLNVPGLVEGSTQCDLDLDRSRAVMLMDLLFIIYILFVVLVTVIAYGIIAKGRSCQQPSRAQLHMEAL